MLISVAISFGESVFFRVFCFGLAVTLSSFVFLLSVWSVRVAALFNTSSSSIHDATMILGSHKGSSYSFADLVRRGDRIFVDFQHRRFVWQDGAFQKLKFPVDQPLSLLADSKGLVEVEAIRDTFGSNDLSLPVPSFKSLFLEHCMAPFFVLQVFFVLLWLLDEYFMYALLTGVMLGLMEALNVWKRLKTMRFLRSMIQVSAACSVNRKGKWVTIPSSELVPGDVFQVASGIVPCDAALVSGSCVVNEATLTGENVALLKDAVTQRDDLSAKLSLADDRVHVLFGGTVVLQHAVGARAVALRTGFASSQGKVLRAIENGAHVSANSVEALFFILFLLSFALAAAGYVLRDGLARADKSPYKLLLQVLEKKEPYAHAFFNMIFFSPRLL